MRIEDYKNDYYTFTDKLSNIARHLTYVGFGGVWILIGGVDHLNDYVMPKLLIVAMFTLALSVICDILQYSYQCIFTYNRFRGLEKKDGPNSKKDDYFHSNKYNIPSNVFFISKVVFVLISYILIASYIFKIIFN